MIWGFLYYLPYLILFIIYYNARKARKELVVKLRKKEEITSDDELLLHINLSGEYMFLLFGIYLLSYEFYLWIS